MIYERKNDLDESQIFCQNIKIMDCLNHLNADIQLEFFNIHIS